MYRLCRAPIDGEHRRVIGMLLARFSLIACVAISLLSTAALAQTANYTSVEATSEKPVQLSYHGSAHKDCTPAPLPTVRIMEPPKSGMLTVRRATLTTDKVAGCPAMKTPAQIVLYQARAGYEGPDHVKYEVTSENGEVATYDVTITIKNSPAQRSPTGTPGAQQL